MFRGLARHPENAAGSSHRKNGCATPALSRAHADLETDFETDTVRHPHRLMPIRSEKPDLVASSGVRANAHAHRAGHPLRLRLDRPLGSPREQWHRRHRRPEVLQLHSDIDVHAKTFAPCEFVVAAAGGVFVLPAPQRAFKDR